MHSTSGKWILTTDRVFTLHLTITQWDILSRRWKQRKHVQNISLLVADEAQLVGSGEVGPVYEVVISRTRYVSAQTDNKTRIVACSVPLANARDFGDWMGANAHTIFNFMPRFVPKVVFCEHHLC